MSAAPSTPDSGRPCVVIAGAGVAGLETLLALRALAGDRVDITILSPARQFVNESMSVDRPFRPQRGRGIRLERMLADLGARWVRGELDHVEPARGVAVSRDRDQLRYDKLVLAVGARPKQRLTRSLFYRDQGRTLTYCGGRDGPDYRLLLRRVHEGRVTRLAFVRPGGPSWPLPLYDLALLTAADCATRNTRVELSLVTPEEKPLGIFGNRASAAVRRLLEQGGVALHTAGYGEQVPAGWLRITPGDRGIQVDRIVTEPRLVGPHVRGVSCDRDGFIHTDAHGRVPEFESVFAAGDATSFPVKQGGLAAQQADAVAEMIAASLGIDLDPQPFRPVLRGVLLTGGPPRYLRSDISGGAGDDSTISPRALWWPPNKLAGRYLAPYLSSQVSEAADVLPQQGDGIAIETPLEAETTSGWPALIDLPETNAS